MMRFTVTCHGSDSLGLRDLLERFANEQWFPAHVTREEAAVIVLDQFKRTIAQTLALSAVTAEGGADQCESELQSG